MTFHEAGRGQRDRRMGAEIIHARLRGELLQLQSG